MDGVYLSVASGIACVAGASIICVDALVRLIPSQQAFRIQDSNGFLASSLSLSFGVMLFSALYSMLPSAERYLFKDGWPKQMAGFIMMGCFVGGFFGIQIVSRFLHQFLPSHVVDCDHTHNDVHDDDDCSHASVHQKPVDSVSTHHLSMQSRLLEVNGRVTESTPLLLSDTEQNGDTAYAEGSRRESSPHAAHGALKGARSRATTQNRRPSILQVHKRVMSFVKDIKANCDEFGPCYGYSDPCGQECFKHIATRSALARTPTFPRPMAASMHPHTIADVPELDDESTVMSPTTRTSRAQSRDRIGQHHEDAENEASFSSAPSRHPGHSHHPPHSSHSRHSHYSYRSHRSPRSYRSSHVNMYPQENASPAEVESDTLEGAECCSHMATDQGSEDVEAQHHHHVPANAFMSIGLQTVIAIALHKLPEGFIMYATNHASPTLGFSVFMALFVHNIAEGFAMALPLYMALGSRLHAIAWSSLLGGLSQPVGAGLAMLWFKIAKRSHMAINNTAYACLFAGTAGIMTSVALQLFVESLSLNHNRNLSISFAFLGMTLLGTSNAFVSDSH